MAADPRGFKAVENVQRRTWDEEEYAKRAKERAERGDDYVDEAAAAAAARKRPRKEEFEPAPAGAEGPARSQRAYLKARSDKVDYEGKLGKTQVVTSATALSNASGYYCEVCKCVLKDNLNYLDHINGKKHQRALGFSMRVERSTVNQVKNRLNMHRTRREEAEGGAATKPSAKDEYDARVRAAEEEDERERRERKEAKAAAKRKDAEARAAAASAAAAGGGGSDDDDGVDPAMAAMMGFGGFGGGKK